LLILQWIIVAVVIINSVVDVFIVVGVVVVTWAEQ
jgi:hypothetical protein